MDLAKVLDDFDLGVLKRVMHTFYRRNYASAVRQLEQNFNDSDDLLNLSLSTLPHLLRKLEFNYRKLCRTDTFLRPKILYSGIASTCTR